MNAIDSTLPLSSALGTSASATAPTGSLSAADLKKLKSASVQLEATFTGYLMEEFNKGLPGASDSFSSQVYADMFKQTIATKIAETSGKGMASQIYDKTVKMASLSHHPVDATDAAAEAATVSASRLPGLSSMSAINLNQTLIQSAGAATSGIGR